MFTECPECSTAFRVTAKVLQQAGGRVRCGGCGHAFSALEHLTEEMPAKAAPTEAAEAATPDLTSEDKFKETSKQLLQTLSELTGTDEVRIEDTGIEWHVVDEDDDEQDEDEEGIEAEAGVSDSGEFEVDAAPEDESGEVLELVDDDEAIASEAALADEPTDLAASEADDWDDTLDADEDTAAGDDIPLEVEEELAAIHSELSSIDEKDDAEPGDIDSQFEMQAEAMGLEISGSHDATGDDSEPGGEGGIAAKAGVTDSEEFAGGAAPTEADTEEADADEAAAMASTLTDAVAEEISMEGEQIFAAEAATRKPAEAEDAETEKEQIAAAFKPDAEVIELSLAGSSEAEPAHEPEYTETHNLPEQSQEEMTINQEIDQELLAVAAQDQDLRATIVGLDKQDLDQDWEEDEDDDDEVAPEVETIIMEGDQIRGAFEKEREKQRREAALKKFDQAGNLIDSYVARRAIRGGRRSSDPLGWGMFAGVALLVLALFGQVVHANRQSLSTSNLFNQTVGQVYRMLGNPITPQWSITGWQFEATNGNVAEDEDVLTIYSRIGNRSEQPLPYPLIHVSLTDRWEEIIGSAILEPGEYLAADLNPNQPVSAGNNFTAVITIDEPSVDATGFKLNVCYRVSLATVRCATEDFKD